MNNHIKTCSICEVSKPNTEFHYVALGVTTRGCVLCVKKPADMSAVEYRGAIFMSNKGGINK